MLKIKRILKVIFMLGIFGLSYSFFFTTYENIKVNKMIKDFKSRGVHVEELDMYIEGSVSYYRKYMEVPRETLNEISDKNNLFKDQEKTLLGRDGDIYATSASPFKNIPVIHQFISYYYGGHAAILKYDHNNNPVFIEATGFPEEDETIFDYIFHNPNKEHELTSTASYRRGNYWTNPKQAFEAEYFNYFYRDKYIGLTPVNPFLDLENSDELYNNYINTALDQAFEKVENNSLYNFLFFLNMRNKYYCTDLMSRAYEEAYERVIANNTDYESIGYAKRMNDDGFITSVNDLILSKDTFISFYVEIKEELINNEKQIVEYIYYLKDIEV